MSFSRPLIVPSFVLGQRSGAIAPSDRVTVAGIGIGSRGNWVLSEFLLLKEAKFIAVCDVRNERRETIKSTVDKHYGNRDFQMYDDQFELLARQDVEAVLIATGDRWHTPLSIIAAEHVKDRSARPMPRNRLRRCRASIRCGDGVRRRRSCGCFKIWGLGSSFTAGSQGESGACGSARRNRATEKRDYRANRAGLAARTKALDCADSWNDEAVEVRRGLGGAAVELSAADLSQIESAAAQIAVQGDRYPEALAKLTGR